MGDDIVNYIKLATETIDAIRYCVFVSPMQDRAQILWKSREMDDNIIRYKKAVREIEKIPGCRNSHTSRKTKAARRILGECRKLSEEWQKWRTDFVRGPYYELSKITGGGDFFNLSFCTIGMESKDGDWIYRSNINDSILLQSN